MLIEHPTILRNSDKGTPSQDKSPMSIQIPRGSSIFSLFVWLIVSSILLYVSLFVFFLQVSSQFCLINDNNNNKIYIQKSWAL